MLFKGQTKRCYLFILFLLVLPLALAQDQQAAAPSFNQNTPVTFTFTQLDNQALITKALVSVEDATKSKSLTSKLITTNELTFILKKGTYTLAIQFDDLETDAKDYYALVELTLTDPVNKDITLLPVGSLRGTVVDELDNLVNNAQLKFDCDKDYGEPAPTSTDKFGSFTYNYVALGDCKITATYAETAGSATATIQRGKATDVQITLNQQVVSQQSPLLPILVVIAFFVIIVLTYFLKKKKSHVVHAQPKQASEKPQPQKKEGSSQRIQDILKTLEPKERQVVALLLQHNNQLSQARIRLETRIPKTSLVRVFEKLTKKKIITVEKSGRFKKIQLTSWFLEK